MGNNWQVHKTASFLVMGLTAAVILGFGGLGLEEKAFNFIQWKWLVLIGQGYLAWTFNTLLNF